MSGCRRPGRLPGTAVRSPPWAGQQREAAHRDAGEDGRAVGDLLRARRVAKHEDARDGAHQGLEVEEGSGGLGGHPRLRVGEEGEGQQRAADRQSGGSQEGTPAAGGGEHAFGSRSGGQHGERRRQELHGGHRHRVAATQQPGLRHRECGGHQQRRQHQAITADGCAPSPSARDQGGASERHCETRPGQRARHALVPEGGDDRNERGCGADQQRRVADAGPRDADVLQADADRTNVELARLAGLSPAGTLNRVRRLKEAGVIRIISARLDPAAVGFPLQMYVMATLARHDPRSVRVFEDQVRALPQITAADNVAGEVDYVLTVVARDVTELQQVLASLAAPGGQRLITHLRLEEIKPPSQLPLVPTTRPPGQVP